MNGIVFVLRELHHGEQLLTQELRAVAERHRTEHEVHHVATDLAAWSQEHVQRLVDTADAYGLDLGTSPPPSASPGALHRRPADDAEAARQHIEPALALLCDLRDLHLGAAANSLNWQMLSQAARASKDERLHDLVSTCHPRTQRQMRWTTTMIKNLSPQALTMPWP